MVSERFIQFFKTKKKRYGTPSQRIDLTSIVVETASEENLDNIIDKLSREDIRKPTIQELQIKLDQTSSSSRSGKPRNNGDAGLESTKKIDEEKKSTIKSILKNTVVATNKSTLDPEKSNKAIKSVKFSSHNQVKLVPQNKKNKFTILKKVRKDNSRSI